ncbi:MAG: MBL fold metallo-hydrolase [Chloroflexi bacterium]|nr:MBL fold metallo-hydrolase [Chloroflexota bacterium]
MPTEVISGLYQLKVPIPNNPLGWVLPYLIPGDDGYTLVDSGWNTPEAFAALEQELRELHLTFADIKRLLVTHVHPDHYGLAGRIKEICGAQIIVHQRERDFIRSRYRQPEQLLDRMAAWLIENGVPEGEMPDLRSSAMPVRSYVVPVEPDAVLWGGETLDFGLYKFEVFWTPGHSPGHICFYERTQRIILTGDHVLPTITPNVSMHPQQTGNPLGDYLASLKRLEPLEVDDVLPAHEYAFKDLQGRLAEIVEHHDQRLDEMLGIVGERRATAYDVASGVVWATGTFDSFSHWMRRAAISETLAHLEYMVQEGKLRQMRENGVVVYERTESEEG